jgi:hypothetical protein
MLGIAVIGEGLKINAAKYFGPHAASESQRYCDAIYPGT